MRYLYNILKFQDYFYLTFIHEFKGDHKQHSYISVFLSLCVNIVCITIFCVNVSHLFKRNEPLISYSKIDLFQGINITLNTENLLFSIFLRDKNHSPLNNPSLITIKGIYKILYKNKNNGIINTNEYQLDIVNCTNYYNKYEKLNINEQFKLNDIKLHYCFNYSENIILGGRYSDDFYGSLSIYVSKCKNKSDSNIICEPEEKIKEKIQDAWIQIFYSTNSINSENFSNPIQSELSSYYLKLDYNFNKQIYTYFNSLDFLSDHNMLFDRFEKKSIFKLEQVKNDISYNYDEEDENLSTIYVCSAMTKEKVQRKYIKIQEVGASVYGIFYVQCFIAYFILYFPQLRLMDIEIVNVLFDYKPKYLSYKKKKDDEIINRRRSNLKNAKFNPVPILKNIKNAKRKSISQTIIKTKSIKEFSYRRINTCDIIKIYVCGYNNKYKKSKEEMEFLMKEKRKYTDLAESLKIYLLTEKIKDLIIQKGIADNNYFTFHKKLLRYDSKYGLRAYEGKMTSTIFKNTINLKEKISSTAFLFDNTIQLKKNNSDLSISFGDNENNNINNSKQDINKEKM